MTLPTDAVLMRRKPAEFARWLAAESVGRPAAARCF
jgi:hypothetical protein